jgi:hypothetical protein
VIRKRRKNSKKRYQFITRCPKKNPNNQKKKNLKKKGPILKFRLRHPKSLSRPCPHVAVRAGEYGFKRVKLLRLIAVQPFFRREEWVKSEILFSHGPILILDWMDSFWRAFLPDGLARDHPGANVFGSNADEICSVRFPATLIFIGRFACCRIGT